MMHATSSTSNLLATLDRIIAVLEAEGETHWRMWLSDSRDAIRNGDAWGIDYLLKACGGMGSFNDLVLSGAKSDRVLSALRARASQLARAIKREREACLGEIPP